MCTRLRSYLSTSGLLAKRQHDGRDDVGERHPVLLHRLQALFQVESRHRHDRRAEVEAKVHDDDHAVDVKEGKHAEHDVAVADVQDARRLQHVRHQVAVREHHAFRQARGAARVGKHDHLRARVDRDGGRIAVLARAARQTAWRRSASPKTNTSRTSGLTRGVHRLVEAGRHRHQRARAGVLELPAQLGGCVERD